MRRFFRVVDCTRHLGMPIRVACIVLNLLSCPLYAFTLFFLPLGAAIPLMITEGVIGLIGLVASITRLRLLTLLYIIAQSIMLVPVWVVIGYVMYTVINYDYYTSTYCYYRFGVYTCYNYNFSYYQLWLFEQSLGLLWVVMIAGFIGSILASLSIAGFRKLRLFQSGVHNVTRGHRGGHRHAVVVQQPATVYQTRQPIYSIPQPQQTTVYQTTTYGAQQGYPQPAYPQQAYPQQGYQPQPAYPQQAMMPPQQPPSYGQ